MGSASAPADAIGLRSWNDDDGGGEVQVHHQTGQEAGSAARDNKRDGIPRKVSNRYMSTNDGDGM